MYYIADGDTVLVTIAPTVVFRYENQQDVNTEQLSRNDIFRPLPGRLHVFFPCDLHMSGD